MTFRATDHRVCRKAKASALPAYLKRLEDDSRVPAAYLSADLPFATSQSLTVLSSLAEARVLPSGLNATDLTSPICS